MKDKTTEEAWKDLKEALFEFLVSDYWNMFIGVLISLIPLAILGVWDDRLIISLVAFAGAIFGFVTKIATRFAPIRKYFKLKE